MKLTKANVTKLLDKHGVSKRKLFRGRITYEATEGMEYEFVNNEALVITYRSRTSSFASRETWYARKAEKINKIVEVLNANGFVAVTDGNEVTVTKG